jgi:protein-disulfide isomerase
MENSEEKLTKRERKALAKEQKKLDREKQERVGKIKKLAVVALILGLIGFGGYKAWKWINTPTEEVTPLQLSISENDWVKGNRNASVVIYEFSDFQCPACATYYPVIKQVVDEFGDKVAFVYKQFPLESIHNNARPAAIAAEAAGVQGKFWEMHDKLFESQAEWAEERNPEDKFIEFAQELELDLDKFKADMESSEIKERIDRSIQLGYSLGINSTPTMFINGEKIQLPSSYDAFKSAVEQYMPSEDNQP